MISRILFIVNAVVLVAFGLWLFLSPTTALAQFRMDARVTELFLTRVVGVALVALGAVLFFAQNADESVQRFMGMAALAGAVLALIVTVMGVIGNGPVRSNGWIPIIVELLFALAYAFVIFVQPRLQRQQPE
jgi:hypothetical protein